MNSSPNGAARLPESSYVLDASALLAVILREPGQDVVASAVAMGAVANAVNVSEVVAKLLDVGYSVEDAVTSLNAIQCRCLPFDTELAWQAGLLRAQTRAAGLSLGDRACLALASSLGLPALTADRAWAGLDVDVKIVLCR